MPSYPLVVRNNIAVFHRGFSLVFLTGVALITYVALLDGPPEPQRWWPLIMLVFWAAGVFGLLHALNLERSVVTIANPGSIHIRRGKAFRSEEHWLSRGRFWIEEGTDSEGGPYFRLVMEAPGGLLAVKEGHSRKRLEHLLAQLEAAVSGH